MPLRRRILLLKISCLLVFLVFLCFLFYVFDFSVFLVLVTFSFHWSFKIFVKKVLIVDIFELMGLLVVAVNQLFHVTPWIQDVNLTYIRRSQDVLNVF